MNYLFLLDHNYQVVVERTNTKNTGYENEI